MQHRLTTVPQTRTNAENHYAELQVTTALSTMQRHYQENIAAFAETMHELSMRIDECKSDIEKLKREIAPHETELERFHADVAAQTALLENLNERYIRKCSVLEEFEKELARSKNTEALALQHRYDELEELLEEIEALEITLLQKELERQNIILRIEPQRQRIIALENEIGKLEAQKRYIESAKLHDLMPKLGTSTAQNDTVDNDEEIIDTETHEVVQEK
jgi:chromosome segregation ATPase